MRLFSNIRILCVDDDQDSCELLEYMLSFANSDYQVTTISSSKEALSLISSNSFDLYIFDCALPDASGIELCREVRQTDDRTPILFFSAMAFAEDKTAALHAGATEYLVKPNDLNKLTETVEKLLSPESPFF
jgi:DNA-binding response OmpR family regulator